MSISKLSDLYGYYLKNAFETMYNTMYNGNLGYQIGFSKVGESCPFFGDYVTSPNTFTVERYNGQKYGKSSTSTNFLVEHTFTTPLSTFTIEGTFILPDINPDALAMLFKDSNNKTWGFAVSNEGYILPVFNSMYQGSVVTITSNTPVKFKIEWTQDESYGISIYINDVLESEWSTTDYTMVKTNFKFVQNVYINKLMFSWDNDDYIDWSKYLYNIKYQIGAEGSTVVPYQIGYLFTNEGTETNMTGKSMLTKRTVSLELRFNTTYEFLDLDLYKLSQLIYYFETELLDLPVVTGVNINIADQEIIEEETSESYVTIKTFYRIELFEQHDIENLYGVEE
jgi:hypothetical protein